LRLDRGLGFEISLSISILSNKRKSRKGYSFYFLSCVSHFILNNGKERSQSGVVSIL